MIPSAFQVLRVRIAASVSTEGREKRRLAGDETILTWHILLSSTESTTEEL